MPAVELIGFAPDKPSTTPGVMSDCVDIVPAENGFAGAPSGVAIPGLGALVSPARGAAVVTLATGTRRTFAGTSTRLYELLAGAWADVSRASFYSGGTDARWSFAQYGSTTIAANDTQILQASTTSGAFADIAGSPSAKVVFSVGDFVMALNTNEATYGDQGDRWWCSGIFNHATWAASVSTQANSGRLVGVGGDLVAGLALGAQAVAYKTRAMWLGSYVGGTAVWQWDRVPGDQGAVGQEAVCDVNGMHFFVGENNFWLFDGVRATPVGDSDVRQWFYANSSAAYRYRTIVQYERQNNRVWVFYASAGSTGDLDSSLVYHLKNGRWGRSNRPVQCALSFVQPGLSIDGLSTLSATIDGLTAPVDSQFFASGGSSLSVFDSTNLLRTMTGSSVSSAFTSGDIGDDWSGSRLSRVRLRFVLSPTSSSATGQVRATLSGTPSGGGAGVLSDGGYDLRQAGRWHRLSFAFTGPVQVSHLDHDLRAEGRR